jgi:ABC-type sulfate transport system permease subunit
LAPVSFRAARLGVAEWAIAIGGLALLVDLFAVSWFAYDSRFHVTALMLGQKVSANGWQSFSVIGPLALVVGVAGIALGWLVATRRSPAVPVVVTTLLLPFSLALVVALVIRVVISPPSVHLAQAGGGNVISAQPGAYVGLVLSVVIFAGTYAALRREGVPTADSPAEIESLPLSEPRGSSAT